MFETLKEVALVLKNEAIQHPAQISITVAVGVGLGAVYTIYVQNRMIMNQRKHIAELRNFMQPTVLVEQVKELNLE